MLRTRMGSVRCYLTVFPFGTGLSVGWTMLDEPHLWNVVGSWLRPLVQGGGWFRREARTFEARALRDLLHQAGAVAVATAAARSTPPEDRWPQPTVPVGAPAPRAQFRDSRLVNRPADDGGISTP